MALKFHLYVFENITDCYESSQISLLSLSTHALSDWNLVFNIAISSGKEKKNHKHRLNFSVDKKQYIN